MKKTYNVDETFNNMRIDRWIRKNFGKLPQGFIEKNLRNGKIKIDNKKIRSSHKLKTNEKIDFFDFNFKIIENDNMFIHFGSARLSIVGENTGGSIKLYVSLSIQPTLSVTVKL